MAGTRIIVGNNGPLRVQGDFEVVDQNGNLFNISGRTVVAFCRCGQSANKPFCDGTHKQCNFQSEVVAFELPPPKPKI
jgi:CDGSH-type Zn-finger protein